MRLNQMMSLLFDFNVSPSMKVNQRVILQIQKHEIANLKYDLTQNFSRFYNIQLTYRQETADQFCTKELAEDDHQADEV